jgi:hypothetical protein
MNKKEEVTSMKSIKRKFFDQLMPGMSYSRRELDEIAKSFKRNPDARWSFASGGWLCKPSSREPRYLTKVGYNKWVLLYDKYPHNMTRAMIECMRRLRTEADAYTIDAWDLFWKNSGKKDRIIAACNS